MTEIRKEFGKITVDLVKPHMSNANKAQAQIRQVVKTIYPSTRVGNSMTDSIVDVSEFNIGDGKSFEENRVTWIDVPADFTKEKAQDIINNKFPNARIWKRLSLDVKKVLSDEQIRGVEEGFSSKTYEAYMHEKAVKDAAGNYIPFRDVPQYKGLGFSKAHREDEDFREAEYNHTHEIADFRMNSSVSENTRAQVPAGQHSEEDQF